MATDTGTGTAEVTGELTADDIAALRTSTDYTLHFYRGAGYIRVYFGPAGAGDGVPIYTPRQQRLYPESGPYGDGGRQRTIPVLSAVSGYLTKSGSGMWSSREDKGAACYFRSYDGTIAAIAHIVRPGDALQLSWTADNNTDNIREVGYHADNVHCYVIRPKGAKVPTLKFLVGTEVGPDNSARMVRRYGT